MFYYLTTEPLFIEAFTKWSVLSKIDMFECREAIYGRLCLKVVASVLAFIIQIALLVTCDKSFLSQNVLCRSNFFGIDKTLIAFSAHANNLFEQKMWDLHSSQFVNQFLLQYKKFGPAQNI